MNHFKKIDCIVQSILMIISLTVILLPLLGAWQIISLVTHIFTKKLTFLHKIYLVTLLIATIIIIIYDSLSKRTHTLSLLIFFGYVLGTYYLVLSYQTLKK